MSQAFDRVLTTPPRTSPLSGLERLASALAHGVFLIFLIPMIAPLMVLLVFTGLGRATPYVRSQALQAMLFQALLFIVAGPMMAYFVVAMGKLANWSLSPLQWADAFASDPGPTFVLLVAMIVILVGSLLEFVAAAQALRGQPYNLPLVGRWIRS